MMHWPNSRGVVQRSEARPSRVSGGGWGVIPPSGALALKKLAPLIALCALSACGFKPVHSTATRAEYATQIESVDIQTDGSRLSQLLKAEIEDTTNPMGRRSEKLFVMAIAVNENEIALFISPDGTSGRGDYRFESTYTLSRKFDGKVIDTGTISRSSSYSNAQTADFSTFISREAAHKQGMLELAQDYKLRLANLVGKINDPFAMPASDGKLPRTPITRPLDPSNTNPSAPRFENPLGDPNEASSQGR